MIAVASAGPTPLSVSSVVSSAVLMLTIATPPGPVVVPGAPATDSPSFGTRICCPSTSGAARFSRLRSAPSRAPPARSTASTTRAPGSNGYTPGRWTQPATSTISCAVALADAPGEPEAGTPDAGDAGAGRAGAGVPAIWMGS